MDQRQQLSLLIFDIRIHRLHIQYCLDVVAPGPDDHNSLEHALDQCKQLYNRCKSIGIKTTRYRYYIRTPLRNRAYMYLAMMDDWLQSLTAINMSLVA
jgi:hypothetical protein